MKTIKYALLTMITAILVSCGDNTSTQPLNSEGFGALEKELKDKFGDKAYYTDLNVGYDEHIGIWIATTVTDNPESLQMGEWNLSQNNWKQNSDITLEIPEGSKASDFMFQLDDQFSVAKLGELVEQSIAKLKAEKKIKNPALSIANIKFPKNGDVSNAEYHVQLTPENGGTSFNFYYQLDGTLTKMDY